MTIRTAKLSGPVIVTNIAQVLYTCPAGKHVRVRSIRYVNVGTATGFVSFAVGNAATTTNRFWHQQPAAIPGAQTGSGVQLTADVVLEAGETLEAVTTLVLGATVVVRADGTIYDN